MATAGWHHHGRAQRHIGGREPGRRGGAWTGSPALASIVRRHGVGWMGTARRDPRVGAGCILLGRRPAGYLHRRTGPAALAHLAEWQHMERMAAAWRHYDR